MLKIICAIPARYDQLCDLPGIFTLVHPSLTLQCDEHKRAGHTVQQYDEEQETMREPLARPLAELLVDVEGGLLADVEAGFRRCERKVLQALELLEHKAAGRIHHAAERIHVRR